MKTKIVIVDAQILDRECLAMCMAREPDFEVVAQCSGPEDALQVIRQQTVSVLLFSCRTSIFQAYLFLKEVRRSSFSGLIFIKVPESNRRLAEHVARSVAADVVLTSSGVTQLLRSIRSGKTWEGRPYPTGPSLQSARYIAFRAKLTKREKDVLTAVVDGLANKEIAAQLEVSESSIKCTVQQLFRKADVRTRSQLVRKVLEVQMNISPAPDTKIA